MEPLTYIIALMGCTDDGTMCRQVRMEQARYPTAAACQAALDNALWRNSDINYPIIQASCQRKSPGWAKRPAQKNQKG